MPYKRIDKISLLWKLAAGIILVAGGTVFLTRDPLIEIKRHVLLVNQAVTDERWPEVLSLTKYCVNETPLILAQSNLALYQTGILLDSMFAYPQSKGPLGLLMNQTWCASWPKEASNISWKLGLVNESQHWGHEAFERKGPTPDLLKRLGTIYMMKGENNAASHYLLNLKDVLFQGSTAENLIRLNENPTAFAQDSMCKYVQSCMLVEDLVSGNRISSPELEQLFKRNPKNKMAFEYLIAYHLLNANIRGVWDQVSDFRTLNYPKIPRHVQEAMIVAATMIPNFDVNQLKGWVDPKTIERFMAYRKILASHKENRIDAHRELQAWFGDTYWYYLMFVKSAPRQPEDQIEYQ
jgi:hypothetical protein